jgi:hypothetical protein
MTAKGKKPVGFLMFLQNILSWLAGFSVKIHLLATPVPSTGATGQADLHRHTDVYPPTWQKVASGWRNALAKDDQTSSI